jgi:hypothetical protein
MDATIEAILRSKEELIRSIRRVGTDSLRWRVEQRGVQKWVILSKNSDKNAIVFEYPHDYFGTLTDQDIVIAISDLRT